MGEVADVDGTTDAVFIPDQQEFALDQAVQQLHEEIRPRSENIRRAKNDTRETARRRFLDHVVLAELDPAIGASLRARRRGFIARVRAWKVAVYRDAAE